MGRHKKRHDHVKPFHIHIYGMAANTSDAVVKFINTALKKHRRIRSWDIIDDSLDY